MDCVEYQCGSGVVVQQFVEEQFGLGGGVVGIGKVLFGGKGVGFQLVQQLGVVGGDYFELWVMYMVVDEVGQQQVLWMFFQWQVGGQLWQQVGCVIECVYVVVFDLQQVVFEIFLGFVVEFCWVVEEMQDLFVMG